MKAAVVISVVTAFMVLAASAFAANGPTKSVYDLKPTQVQGMVGGASTTPPTTPSAPATASAPQASPSVLNTATPSSSLPFTGIDLGLFAVAGVVLVGIGVSLRRVTQKHPVS
jgi:hypothetical protein